MTARNLIGAAFALGLACGSSALAGDPSGQGASIQTGAPGPIDIALPPVNGRGAYVTQIGQGDVARITQTAPIRLRGVMAMFLLRRDREWPAPRERRRPYRY